MVTKFAIRVMTLLLAVLGLVAVACGGDDEPSSKASDATVITASMKEFGIDLTTASATAGEVKFKTVNNGALPHEFKAIKTDVAADKLALDGAKVDEGKYDVAKKTDTLAAGETRDVTFDLSSGRYVLICNVEGHYQAGMHAAFTVN
jgi:uncharacterized cupredoxin-like copper-binding protein